MQTIHVSRVAYRASLHRLTAALLATTAWIGVATSVAGISILASAPALAAIPGGFGGAGGDRHPTDRSWRGRSSFSAQIQSVSAFLGRYSLRAFTGPLRVIGIAAVAVLSASLIFSSAALAGGGAGGLGQFMPGTSGPGGSGGSGFTGDPGHSVTNCGGGGGGAAGGGVGGSGGPCVVGGTGGAAGAADGGQGGAGHAGGGGGGGGANGFDGATITNTSPLSGGDGGAGGNGVNAGGGIGAGGGGGGAGGYGAIVTGPGASSSNTDSITGGRGGNGGLGDGSPPAGAGSAGDGGVGILFTTSGVTFTNSGSVAGGNAGTPGASPTNGSNASGGTGIIGADLTIINSGTIAGGLSSFNQTRANAIEFTGGNNTLTLSGPWSMTGAISLDTNSTSVTFDQSSAQTVDNAINGAGSVIQNGTGTLTLTGNNNYSGSTTISQGTLALSGNGFIASSSAVNLATGTTFDISQQTSGASIVTLGNTAAGQTGIVSLGNQTLTIFGGASTFGGVIQDGGILANTGGALTIAGGTQTLSGANTYTGVTTVSGGTLALTGTGSIAQSSLVTVGAGSASTFDLSGTTSGASIMGLAGDSNGIVALGGQTLTITNASGGNQYFGAINGTGGLHITGGQQILGGTSGYTGVTTIDSGAILGLLGTGSIASSSKVIDNGALDLSATTTGASIASLAATNINANVLLNGGKTLTITAANDAFAGLISGAGGNLVLSGGTQTLSGTNTYTGTTTINGGVLQVDGSIATSSMTTANANATLTGIGTVGNTTIASGGSFTPGSGTPGSSMAVNGSLALQSGAMYVVQLNPTTSSFANVTGTATLGGATVNATYANGSYVSKQYTILTAGSVSGTFGSVVNSNLPANFHTTLSYDAKDAYLDLA
jgi:autotransporter-associated beta strand protein